ncbi:hypothetical protein THRCLA_20821 [Thraustotheca clavata]|uniref:Uncharacterized protein n=1 Tax=Thraustotheca clavata TaxID=74557 RepID=A0A1W0A318_9STRA|nr:hypothetical protein THRCLA_20821 [Thraustotheca clavata]
MKKVKITTTLLPELLQRIAVFSMSSKDMLAFLRAFPQNMLSKPLNALLELFNASYDGRLAPPKNDVHVCLWPELELPNEIQDQKLLSCIKKALALIPMVVIYDVDKPPNLPFTTNTKIKIDRLFSMQKFDTVRREEKSLQSNFRFPFT